MDELGISAIYLDSQVSERTDDAGNIEVRTGHFEWSDGTAGEMAEYWFQRDTADTEAVEVLEVPSNIAALPELKGRGNVYSMHQAMVRDSSGRLIELQEAFASEEDRDNRMAIMDEIIFEWTGVDTKLLLVQGEDAAKAHALRQFYGMSEDDPAARALVRTGSSGGGNSVLVYTLAPAWENTYREIFEGYYGGLMEKAGCY
ncbi:hypothetical protein ACFL2Q_12685 [Thermodesulfobacteriota bacterium]